MNFVEISVVILGILTTNIVIVKSAGDCNEEETSNFCAKPVLAENIVDPKWFHENYNEGMRFQLGNDFFRKRIASWFAGKYIAREDELSKICLKVSLDFIDEHHIIGGFQGFGDQKIDFNCSDTSNIFECDFYNSNKELKDTAKFYISYFDGKEAHNLVGNVVCFSNGDVGWVAATVSKEISEEETNTILDHFKSLGFKTDLRVPMQSPSCP